MKRFVLLLVAVAVSLSALSAEAQWLRRGRSYSGVRSSHCGNPNCGMCNAMFGSLQRRAPSWPAAAVNVTPQRVVTPPAPPAPAVPADAQPTPMEKIAEGLALIQPQPGEILYDLGAGDGRVVNYAAARYGCGAVGIEIDPVRAEVARRLAGPRVGILTGDAALLDLSRADVIYLYLWPETIARLRLPPRARVVSYMHPFPGSRRVGDFYVRP